MPTLLDICGLDIPNTVEGVSYLSYLTGDKTQEDKAVLIQCPHPFGEWSAENGGKEYRGIRTQRYTYVRDLRGPWLLYNNVNDPYQMSNLIGIEEYQQIVDELDIKLRQILQERNDKFLPGSEYIAKFGYVVDKSGTVPYI